MLRACRQGLFVTWVIWGRAGDGATGRRRFGTQSTLQTCCRVACPREPTNPYDFPSTALQPEAPIHVILVSRRHILSVDALREEHRDLWMALLRASQVVARSIGVDVDRVGYELTTHAGRHDTREFPTCICTF